VGRIWPGRDEPSPADPQIAARTGSGRRRAPQIVDAGAMDDALLDRSDALLIHGTAREVLSDPAQATYIAAAFGRDVPPVASEA
jgi:hypothetical protein